MAVARKLKYERDEFERLLDFGNYYLSKGLHREALEKYRLILHELLWCRWDDLSDIYDNAVCGLQSLVNSSDEYVWETCSQLLDSLPNKE